MAFLNKKHLWSDDLVWSGRINHEYSPHKIIVPHAHFLLNMPYLTATDRICSAASVPHPFSAELILLQWNLYKRTLPTADTSHKRTKNFFPNELGIFLIRSTLPRADTSGERTADKIFVQKCKKISKFTSISGQNKKLIL